MDIWIIRDGEKTGPIHDFEIRKKIENGELTADNSAWHEGLDSWKKLSEIPIFAREFEKPSSRRQEPAEFTPPLYFPPKTTPPPIPQPVAFGRRFWARWFDLTFYASIWWLCLWAARQNIEAALMNEWILLVQYVPWFIMEALLLHYVGNTPGKWLLGMKVVNTDGSRLDLAASTRRSLRVMFTGVGFCWPLLAVFCQALSYFTAKRLGATLWDHNGGHRVVSTPLNPFRLLTLIVLFFVAFYLQSIVLFPYSKKFLIESNPEFKEAFDQVNYWHLPKR